MVGTLGLYNHTISSMKEFLFKHSSLKTKAKDDKVKTYWIYPNDEDSDDFERKHILEIRPSVVLAKNVKRKDLVFALLNQKVIEAMWGQLINSNESD